MSSGSGVDVCVMLLKKGRRTGTARNRKDLINRPNPFGGRSFGSLVVATFGQLCPVLGQRVCDRILRNSRATMALRCRSLPSLGPWYNQEKRPRKEIGSVLALRYPRAFPNSMWIRSQRAVNRRENLVRC